MKLRRAIANSKIAPAFSASLFVGVSLALALAALSAAAVWFVSAHGWTLYQGDADAHLMISRRIIDSRNPGYGQLGTVWLPLLHVLTLPFVRVDAWWRNGIAGAFAPATCFVIAGMFLFATAMRLFKSIPAALAATALFALNPNVLYLQSIPMTEAVFFAALTALLYFTVSFGQRPSWVMAVAAGVAGCAATLTRYDGWFLLPFVALYMAIMGRRRVWGVLIFTFIAALGPAYWMAHNWWMTGDWLDFYRGPYSARAIQGSATYPGQYDWAAAWLYYRTAAGLVAGPVLTIAGVIGMAALLWRRLFWVAGLLVLPCIFYVWSMHSGSTPIFVPTLWPHSYYNTRYGTSAIPLFALGAAALITFAPKRWRGWAAAALVLAAVAPWALRPDPTNWATLEESHRNDAGRRKWMRDAAEYLMAHRSHGQSIITSYYPLTGVLREMGVPLREALTGDNGIIMFEAAMNRPDLLLTQEWAIVKGGDIVQTAIQRVARFGVYYHLEARFSEKYEPVVEIYRRAPPPHPVE